MLIAEVTNVGALSEWTPWLIPVVLVALIIVFRVRIAEMAAEMTHVFRSHLGVLRSGSPLAAAQSLLIMIRQLSVEQDVLQMLPVATGASVSHVVRQLFQIEQQILHAKTILPDSFGDILSRASESIGRLRAMPSAQVEGQFPENEQSGRLVPQVEEVCKILKNDLLEELERYCRGAR